VNQFEHVILSKDGVLEFRNCILKTAKWSEMTAPEPSPLKSVANGVMGPPQQPMSPPPDEASSPPRAPIWPNKAGNGFVALENGCKTSLDKPEVIVSGASEQARPAEGAEPIPKSLEAPEAPLAPKPPVEPLAGDQAPAQPNEPSSKPQAAAQQSLTTSQREAIVELEGILTKISALDVGGWFQYPVTERDAPNYHSIIKQPMCFQVRDQFQNP
jgi:hypothetical protein